MRRRLLAAMLLIAGLTLTGFGVPLALSVRALYRDEALLRLSEEAAKAASAVPGSFARENDPPELPKPAHDVSIALFDVDGHKLQGAGPDLADPAVSAALRTRSPQRDRDGLVVAFPINDEETLVGAIRTSTPESVVAHRTYLTWAAMAALAGAVLAGAGLIAARRSRSLTRPLSDLHADAHRIGTGGEIPRRPPTGVREIDTIQHALSQAAKRLNDALARERAFSTDLAHQLRTPLASLRLRIETEQLHDDQQLLTDMLHDLDRLEQTIDDVLALARDTQQEREPHPLATLLRETTSHWRPLFAAAGRQMTVDTEDHLPWVHASPAAIRQILDVLLDNSLTHGTGTVHLSATRVAQGAVVSVADEGNAIINADEIFVRRNPDSSGSGIGLALARRLAEAEDLRLVLAHPGPGVAFHLIFGARRTERTPEPDDVDPAASINPPASAG
ncbi:MAG: HAMP domain-containing histidine kinase [Acidimicrobiia bacterium]|nr:HAMP domain-containing histidine kinase [Acidimicrobiia bacterium]